MYIAISFVIDAYSSPTLPHRLPITPDFNLFKTTESALYPLDVYNLAQTQVSENPQLEFIQPDVFETITPANTPISQIQSSPGPLVQHEDNQVGLVAEPSSAGTDDFNILSFQITGVTDLDLAGFSFDTMALVQDDWLFEGMTEHSS